MNPNRFVLCRPQGGLNDILCQIEIVCRYAEKFDRTVVVDTNYHSTRFIRDRFSRYFATIDSRLILDLLHVQSKLAHIHAVIPQNLANDWTGYDAYFDRELGYFVEKKSRLPITFDFAKDYTEPLLIHHASGRLPGASLSALSRMRLQQELADVLTQRLNRIGSDYAGIHIRNTDYQTNYPTLISQLRSHPGISSCRNLFVATDDFRCLEFCRSAFPNINIFSFSNLPNEPGRPIHRLLAEDDPYERNKDAILDLLMLALADEYFFLEVKENRWGNRYSGFSVLALDLRNSRPALDRLLSRSPSKL